ncbi:MAG: hypothetical protein ACRDVP_12710 [Acidimicrobiales bacterium]
MRLALVDPIATVTSEAMAVHIADRLAKEKSIEEVVHVRWGSAMAPNAGKDVGAALDSADAMVILPMSTEESPSMADEAWLARINEICEAAERHAISSVVFGSSTLGYSPTLTAEQVDEGWPMAGIRDLPATRAFARADELVADFEAAHSARRVVRLRFAAIVTTWTASEAVHGRLWRLRNDKMSMLKNKPVQLTRPDEMASAITASLDESASGPFNLAGPPATIVEMEAVLEARPNLGRWTEAVLRTPVVNTARAERELRWRAFDPVGSVLASRAGSVEREADPADEPSSAVSLYRSALSYFGRCLESLADEEWERFAWLEVTVSRLAALSARDQYRVTYIAEGTDPQRSESQLPQDPLGFERLKGWQLCVGAAEHALERSVQRGDVERIAELLGEATMDLVVRGWCISSVSGREEAPDSDLLAFAAQRSPQARKSLSAHDLFAHLITAKPPVPRAPGAPGADTLGAIGA